MSGSHSRSIFKPYEGEAGEVVIGGRPATEWLDNSGQPHFLYSGARLRQRISELRAAMPAGLRLHYAVKSNPFGPLLSLVGPLVDGFDIASIGELRRLEEAGCSVDSVSFAGPGKTRAEVFEAARRGVKIIVESPHQLALCEEAGAHWGKPVRAMVRLNDQKPRGGGGLSMSGAQTVFGWDIGDFRERGRDHFSSSSNVLFWGLHLYFGSQILQSTAIEQGLEATVSTILDLDLPTQPKLINLGGGLGIPYGPKDLPLDLREVSPAWDYAVAHLKNAFPDCDLCIELGRYISGESGLFIMEVLDVKRIGGDWFVVCSGGLQNFSAATGNFGQVLKRNHPIAPVRPRSGPDEPVTVTGPLCTPMDVFARKVDMPLPRIGDHIAVFQAGAYGFTASPTEFLSHPAAVERLVD